VYEPSPRDSVALAEADLLVENGLEFEEWIEALYSASGSQATRVVASSTIGSLLEGEGHSDEEHAGEEHADEEHADEGHSDEEHADEEHADEEHADEEHADEEHADEEHSHGEYDPHVWHDPTNVMAMVTVIRDALVAADAANAELYTANAEAYMAELAELDAFIEAQVAELPAERRKLVTTHDTFGYFANRYGFEVIGTALGSSTEAADPAAGAIAELVEAIRSAGVPAIFTENVSNMQLMETIANEAGVRLAPELYTDALGEPGSSGATYLEMMRYNVTTIVEALGA
jgi:ABC-type Zn uptake system ZnuABC Zn-binding protein ZnuA